MKKEMINHYHCPECGRLLKEVFRWNWDAKSGIKIFYTCDNHLFVWIEDEEKKGLKKIYERQL